MEEAKLNGNKIEFNGWFRICLSLVAVIFTLVLSWSTATLSYTYTTILPEVSNNIISNDKDSRSRDAELQKQINENRILIVEVAGLRADINSMKGDLERIKNILERR